MDTEGSITRTISTFMGIATKCQIIMAGDKLARWPEIYLSATSTSSEINLSAFPPIDCEVPNAPGMTHIRAPPPPPTCLQLAEVIKFPTKHEMGECQGDEKISRQCYAIELALNKKKAEGKTISLHIEVLDKEDKKKKITEGKKKVSVQSIIVDDLRDDLKHERGTTIEELIQILILEDQPERTFQIGSSLQGKMQKNLIVFI
ncbi:hypothetical protein NE237_023156 [Protea cynaroides]|uniref:Uncharacterized protein n=1 Tax=Protea cynaroides TaxID=273540 RepID=A0A9Q0HB72_9MAGN|nr:hypothetical protein NE237_023156 [Protea cynaroides]